MPRRPALHVALLVILLLTGWGSAVPATVYGSESTRESSTPLFTLDAQKEPLGIVLEKISKTTRWKIKAPDRWKERPVTQTLNKVTLEEGLRSVLKNAGIENLMLVYDENTKVITLFDTESPRGEPAGRTPTPVSVSAQPPVAPGTAERGDAENAGDSRLKRPVKEAEPASSRVNRGTRRRGALQED